MADTPPIDRSVLGAWVAGDDDAIDGLLAIFRDSAQIEMERMRDALRRGDLGPFIQAAERLRGGALSMGASELARAAGRAEAAAKVGIAPACDAALRNVAIQIARISADVTGTTKD